MAFQSNIMNTPYKNPKSSAPLCAIALFTCIFSAFPVFAQFAGGDGSPGNPYQISNKEQLAACDDSMALYSNNFILINDIDVTGDPAYPLFARSGEAKMDGNPAWSPDLKTLGGTFDGGGFTILNKTNSLFDQIWLGYAGTPTIQNLTLSNVNITTHALVKYGGWGALAPSEYYASTGTRIFNVHVFGIISNSSSYVGGLLGKSQGAYISNCTSSAKIYTTSSGGGLLGQLNGGTTTLSTASGDVRTTGSYAGGLAGTMSGGLLYRCGASGNVTRIASEYSGGLVGAMTGAGTIRECYATGNVTYSAGEGGGLVGGSVGNVAMLIEDCYATGDLSGPAFMSKSGGFMGEYGRSSTANHLINRCYATGDVPMSDGNGFTGTGGGANGNFVSNSFAAGGTIGSATYGFAHAGGGLVVGNCFWTNSATSDANATKVANEEYFTRKGNPPLDTWDADNVWYIRPGYYPRLRWTVTIRLGTLICIR